MSSQEHWDSIYHNKAADEVSWYQAEPSVSLRLIESTRLTLDDSIIDVGAGASLLADCLVNKGYQRLTVLDWSPKALSLAQARLKQATNAVTWEVADVLHYKPVQQYALWHDRAVLHFLTSAEDREKYRAQLQQCVCLGGYVIVASFSVGGPTRCSGLDTVQYDRNTMAVQIGRGFVFVDEALENHVTPDGIEQRFSYFVFQKTS